MNKRVVVAAIAVSLLLMALLFLLSYGATGQGGLAGAGRILVVGLVGYLVLQGKGWASLLLSFWFALTGLVLVLGAVGGVTQILVALLFPSVFFTSSVVIWKTRRHGINGLVTEQVVAPGQAFDGGSSG